MGCDIHAHYETRPISGGAWYEHQVREKYKTGVINEGREDEYDVIEYGKLFDDPLCIHRNYSLFAALAGVRNGHGFAGIKTGEPVKPISLPRGLPPDTSLNVRKKLEGWGADAHSHSWLSLTELILGYDWTKGRKRTGMVEPDQFLKYVENGRPDDWFGEMRGAKVREIGHPEMHQRLKDKVPDDGFTYITRVEWTERLVDSCREFVEKTIPAMCRIVLPERFWPEVEPLVRALDQGPPLPLPDKLQDLGLPPDLFNHVRMVFWFDN